MDQHGFTFLVAPVEHHIEHHGGRYFRNPGRIQKIQARWHGSNLPSRHRHILRVAAGVGQRHNFITHRYPGHIGTQLRYGSRNFQPEDVAGAFGKIGSASTLNDIGAVQTRRSHPDQHLVRTRLRDGAFMNCQAFWPSGGFRQ